MAKIVTFPTQPTQYQVDRQQALSDLLGLSRSILDQAQRGDWPAALDQQRQRRELLESFFARAPVPEEADEVATAIQAMLDIDAKVTDIVYSQRQQLLDDSSRDRRSHLAAQAYLVHNK